MMLLLDSFTPALPLHFYVCPFKAYLCLFLLGSTPKQ